MTSYRNFCLGFAVGLLLLAASSAFAADSSPPPTKADDPVLIEARKLIADKKFSESIPILKALVAREDKNADGWNLLGFATRKTGDAANAEKFYKTALALNGEHRGALEYLGMMYVETGRLDDAKAVLKRLDKACLFGCEEYDDLKKAVATGKAD